MRSRKTSLASSAAAALQLINQPFLPQRGCCWLLALEIPLLLFIPSRFLSHL
jgi:hypothetical protein